MSKSLIMASITFSLLLAGCGASKNYVQTYGSDDPVNTGYTKSNKKELSSAVGHVKNKDTRVYDSIYDYFRDKVPGVVIETSGSTTSIYVRGINTITGPTDPMFIVDGVVVDDISHLNPYEVASVDVLKDSEASAYGVQGANGVILITLKKADD
jgi:TonB-dependent SusC/RagA subfamily outer membrane receptor